MLQDYLSLVEVVKMVMQSMKPFAATCVMVYALRPLADQRATKTKKTEPRKV
jgi:hypothetical protein